MIKEIVSRLIKQHGTNNPFEIASQKNIVVLFEDLGNTLGFCNVYKRVKFIHINNNLQEYTQFFVCSHELAHVILHPDVNTPFLREKTFYSVDKIEVEANTFAVELLIPDEDLHPYKHLSIYDIASIFGVPKELAHLKKYEHS